MKDTNKKSAKRGKLEPNGPPFVPPETIADSLKVPDNTILLIPDSQDFVDPPHFIKTGQQRDWFDSYFYHCLPLVMGNQHGFLMLATYDFVCRWNGSNDIDGVSIHILEPVLNPNYVTLESHFGFGILTVQSRYVFRTPKGVNLMVKEPPNYPIHGFSWMNAVIETDNLRRDFTFNIKITQPHLDIYIPRNTPLGCLLPYPRYFLDDYNMAELKDPEELAKSARTIDYFSQERDQFDASPRHRYMEGVDIYNIEFEHHQKTLDHGKWWFSERKKHVPAHSPRSIKEPDHGLMSGISNIFRKFLLLTANNFQAGERRNTDGVKEERLGNGSLSDSPSEPALDRNSAPFHDRKVMPTGKEASNSPPQILESQKMLLADSRKDSVETGKCPIKHGEEPLAAAKCPVKHAAESSGRPPTSLKETADGGITLNPKDFPEIMELNADLPESTITLYLPPFYDKSLAPVKAERLRPWFETDSKTKDHARFCLPLTMGAGIGWFIRSPATFTVSWDGDPTHDAQVEILDGCSHADIDNHSAHGSFTIQSQFVPRTKRAGDFVVIKGIANQYRLPYYFLEAMLEAWWSPANFGLVALLNQAGKFTIQKGEPVAQMFVLNIEQATYDVLFKEGYPTHWKEWDDKRRDPSYVGKNLDYLKGLWPDETPVRPHFKNWGQPSPPSEKSVEHQKEVADHASASISDLVRKTRLLLNSGNYEEAEHWLNRAVAKSAAEKRVGLDLISTMHGFAGIFMQKSNFDKAISILSQALKLCQRAENTDQTKLAGILTDLAYCERRQGLLPSAERHYTAALEIITGITNDEIPIANSMFYLGSLLDQMGRYSDSEPLILEALELRKRRLGEQHPDTLFAVNGLACLLTHQLKTEEAEELFAIVIRERTKVLGQDSPEVADSYNDLGFLYRDSGRYQKAEEAFQKAVEIRKIQLGEEDLGVAEFLNNLAFVYQTSGQMEKARSCFETVLGITERQLPANDPLVKRACANLAYVCRHLGEHARAEELEQRAARAS